MNSIGLVIANQDPDFVLCSKAIQNRLYCAVLVYMFRGIEAQELSEEFKLVLGWSGSDCIVFRRALRQVGAIQKNLKFYMYARICGYDVAYKDFQVSETDARWANRIMRSKTDGATKLRKLCMRYHRKGYKPISLATFDKHLARLPGELREHLGKLVGKKMRFLTDSSQIGSNDTRQDLLEEGLYAVYKAYPEIQTPLHLVNIAKNAVHNRAMNIIKEQTTASRSRVTKNDDGSFSGTLLSINASISPEMLYSTTEVTSGGAMVVCNSLMSGLDGRPVEGERPDDVDRARELRLLVEGMVSTMSPQAQTFVHLMMGEHSDEFSDWLGKPNTEVYEKSSREAYLEKVRVFLDIPVPNAKRFVKKLRDQLSDYRN